ncbi:cytidylate kinase-like family protein [Geomonas sp. Red32]|uniref:cytidylate kinase-like family protein n=1 Tax=Geomonas sp. Red32 TaxID=2912856 RepID=UPI00202CBA04|nr:cytidylate kinase-like family protein [Geomonas sp. Red32]MCM0083812.1 cytidylate kinase-like family protein [Geomonas sp. Red32]
MTDKMLIPSVEERIGSLIEVTRRNLKEHGIAGERLRPTVTLTREYGCQGYPVAVQLQAALEKRTGAPWLVMDRALLEAVAQDHRVSEEILANIGSRHRFLDDMLSTFTPRWKSDKDYYRLLARQILALAQEGNVILVGRGAAILTQEMTHCFHFRIVAPIDFKIKSVMARTKLPSHEAQDLISDRQGQRDAFLKDFLGRDIADPTLYHLVFNNARCTAGQIVSLMTHVMFPKEG